MKTLLNFMCTGGRVCQASFSEGERENNAEFWVIKRRPCGAKRYSKFGNWSLNTRLGEFHFVF